MYELGEQLIDRSYVIFYYVVDQPNMNSKGPTRYVKYIPYVYKLDFNETVRTNFYENYYNVENGIDQCDFPMKYITNAHDGDPNDVTSFTQERRGNERKTLCGYGKQAERGRQHHFPENSYSQSKSCGR